MTTKRPTYDDLVQMIMDLAQSYECHSASNKPDDEWDEYDAWMYPIWRRAMKMVMDEAATNPGL